MELTDRIVRIVYVEGTGLICSDAFGRVHLLDDDLNVIRSSPRPPQGRPLYGLTVAGPWVIGKDRMGAVLRWSLDTLDLVNRLDPANVCDPSTLIEREEPSPVTSRGIGVWDGRVYVTSGYHHQMLVIDLETFEVLEIRPNICGESPMEWASTDHPTQHAISDKEGNLRFGNFATMEFPKHVKLDDGSIHRVRYDARHHRFWCTQDFGEGETADVANGIVVVSTDGEKEDEALFARDDVEFVIFSPDYMRAYSGGFDSELHIFDNSEKSLRIERVVGGFSHQLSDITVGPTGDVFVLCQDGEIVKLTEDGTFVRGLGFRRQAVWDIQPSVEDLSVLYCATDSGVAVAEVHQAASGPTLRILEDHETGYGFTRRVAPVDGGWLAITRDRHVFRAVRGSPPQWDIELPSLLHTVAVSPDGNRALVASNSGAVELDARSGEQLAVLSVDGLPVWTSAYLPTGERVLGTRNGVIALFDDGSTEPTWRLDQGDYPKRLWAQGNYLYVVGDGGLKEIEIGHGVRRQWGDLLSNTAENATIHDGLVCVSSYGMQIGAYSYEGDEFLGFLEELPGYPKALATIRDTAGVAHLLVGCRTGVLSLYRLDKPAQEGTFGKLEDCWLPRRAAHYRLGDMPVPEQA
ncbi:WD40 repeat domain-containing protein [Streptomyces pseudovenezuelae]|uniref:WD40 repeat protein n=1 Tax=Streptomyces pseudovenezuelae TaxID=67350 RepID=A0ABT6LZ62_9ACTN|nr:WD40 repeat domain-containing protein [Streptomyces pseudovenezuelae]MDH6221595.1 WD40 repeat protein [Streptomyces pseudovenezuelae]